MLQEIGKYRLNNHYDPGKRANEESLVIAFRGDVRNREVLIKIDEEKDRISLPRVSDIRNLDLDKVVFAFTSGDEDYYLFTDDGDFLTTDAEFEFRKMTEIRRGKELEPRRYLFAIYTAFHLYEWYDSSRFCGKCGAPTVNDTVERARVCTKCGNKIYPRINPAVIIGVTDKESGRILLTKYRTGFSQNALVAGFTEIGETLEETVAREVMEEVGLKVTNIRYYKSQPWGIASDILAGFYCDVCGDKEIKMDESELKYAQWVAPSDIVLQVPDYSLTNEMMRIFKEKGYNGTI